MNWKMVRVLGVLLASVASGVWAHDEGHGPKLTDSPKQGGIVSPVIAASEAKKGAKAAVVYKAELVRLEDGTAQVYLYDMAMNALDLSGFEKIGKGIIEVEKKGKYSRTPFELTLHGDHFMGNAPQPARKPFNIDVHLKAKGQEMLAAFDNLD